MTHTTHNLYGNPNGDYLVITIHGPRQLTPSNHFNDLQHLGTVHDVVHTLHRHLTDTHTVQRGKGPGNSPQAQLAQLLGVTQQSASRYLKTDGHATTPSDINWTEAVKLWHQIQPPETTVVRCHRQTT